jgi:hypothetical protein
MMHSLPFTVQELDEIYLKNNHYYLHLIDFYKEFTKNCCYPPGHFYGPITDLDEVREFEDLIFKQEQKEIPGIFLNEEEQLQLAREFAAYYPEMPFPEHKQDSYRYYFINDQYSYTDAIILYSFLRHFKPGKVIEVGSGYSSAIMLDTNNAFFKNKIGFTFIDPNPERLERLINNEDRSSCRIYAEKVQKVPLEVFQELKDGDILFIDGSHVSKTGSDINHILFHIFPLIAAGVIIHIHDIFYPFEYPSEWVYEGRNWNESYLLRAFLSHNSDYKILFWNSFMHRHHGGSFAQMSNCYKNYGGSIWLRKVK